MVSTGLAGICGAVSPQGAAAAEASASPLQGTTYVLVWNLLGWPVFRFACFASEMETDVQGHTSGTGCLQTETMTKKQKMACRIS